MTTPRIGLHEVTPTHFAAMNTLAAAIQQEAADRGLEPLLLELVRIRASQINGCTFCLDMHTGNARAMGETEHRLEALRDWAGAPLFTRRERAALAFAESVTSIQELGVPDQIYRRAADEFGETGLALLLWTLTVINAYNRLAIATRVAG